MREPESKFKELMKMKMKRMMQGVASLLVMFPMGSQLNGADTIKIAYPNWAEGIAVTHVAKAVLEDKMGYEVELTLADPGVIYAAVAGGSQDAFLDAWLPNTHEPYWDEFGSKLDDLGSYFGFGVTGLVVPSYVKIDRIDQLNDIADDLDGKIIGIGTGAGIYRNTNKAIEEYDLDLEQVASSGPAMTAALAEAYEGKKPIVVTGWKPHWKFGRFDLKVLKDPKGIYPIDGCKKIVRKGLDKEMPEVVQFLRNLSLTEAHLLEIMIAIDEAKGDDPGDVAMDWVLRNEPLVDSWLPR